MIAQPGSRVVVVDDEARLREILCRILSHAGVEVRVAVDPSEGRAAAREFGQRSVFEVWRLPKRRRQVGVRGIRKCSPRAAMFRDAPPELPDCPPEDARGDEPERGGLSASAQLLAFVREGGGTPR